jgi:voltage-gated potassium channel
MRKRIFEFIEPSNKSEQNSGTLYDIFMMVIIIASLVPLMFKEPNALLNYIDKGAAVIFIIDYLLRLITADYKLRRGASSFILYPFTPMAIIDLLAIVPSFTAIAGGFRVLKVFRLLRTFRVFRAFKALRYSKSIGIITEVIREQKEPLVAVCTLAVGYILLSALVVFNVEPDSFETFFDAIYWATVSLTTVGYGDIYPVSDIGRIVTMLSSLFGIAVVALPAGIITAGYIDKLSAKKKKED